MNTTNTISKIIEASIEKAKDSNEFPDFGSKKILVDQLPKDLFFGFSTIIFFEPKSGNSLHFFAL